MAVRSRILCVGLHFEELMEALRSSGYEVMLVPTLNSALACLNLFPPALILVGTGAVDEPANKLPARYSHVPLLLVPTASSLDLVTLQQRISTMVRQNWQAQAG
jgi:hypothetical protein